MRLDEKLVHLRKKKGITQAELAESMKVSRQAVSKWESGGSAPSTDNLRGLSELYGVHIDYLLKEEEEPVLQKSTDNPETSTNSKRKFMKINLKRVFFLIIICLVFYLMYVIHCLRSFYLFDSLLQEESPAKIVHCSLDICSSENELTIPIDVDSELFEHLFQALQSEQYTKPLTSILGFTVSAYHIEAYPFYRILLQHEDRHRTEVVVNGSLLLIGSTSASGLTVYQTSNDTSLSKSMNSLF